MFEEVKGTYPDHSNDMTTPIDKPLSSPTAVSVSACAASSSPCSASADSNSKTSPSSVQPPSHQCFPSAATPGRGAIQALPTASRGATLGTYNPLAVGATDPDIFRGAVLKAAVLARHVAAQVEGRVVLPGLEAGDAREGGGGGKDRGGTEERRRRG